MVGYALSRVWQSLLTILLVLVVVFVLARLAGDPTALLLPPEATDADIAAFRHAYGLDKPIPEQFVVYVLDAFHFDFGQSLRGGGSAAAFILQRLPATLWLAAVSLVVSLVLALGIGLLVELTTSERLRTFVLGLALVREAVPVFVFGLLSILVFGVWLGWFPFIGFNGPLSFVLPVATLSSATLAMYLRILRSSFAGEERREYVRTAIAKGATRRHLVLREVLPNVLLPFVTTVAINLGYLIVGSVLVESVFSWPGVAYAVVQAVEQRDFPVIQAGVVLMAVVFVVFNLLADLVNTRIDPRVKVA